MAINTLGPAKPLQIFDSDSESMGLELCPCLLRSKIWFAASGITQPLDQVPGPSTHNSPLGARRKFSASALIDLSDSSNSDDALISKKKKKLSEFERKRLRRAKEER